VNGQIESLNHMNEQCLGGIATTKNMIVAIQTEKQALSRIFERSEHDKGAQRRELHVLVEARHVLQEQIARRVEEIEVHKSDILTGYALLSKRAQDFDAIMTKIDLQNEEYRAGRQQTAILEEQKEHINDLQFNYNRLFENMNIARARVMGLYFEGEKRRNIHPWIQMAATRPEHVRQIRYHRHLSARLVYANIELKRLREERDRLKAIADEQMAKSDAALPRDVVLGYMMKYTEDLTYKSALIAEMHRRVNDRRFESGVTSFNCITARATLSRRRTDALQLKSLVDESRQTDLGPFLTQHPRFLEAETLGSGFKPHPPTEPRNAMVPRLNIEFLERSNQMRMPQSQRYQRPNIGVMRKKLARPHTGGKSPSNL
jgi:hypothetical protein